jgi:DNA-binding LytR/AlgR family response regulator
VIPPYNNLSEICNVNKVKLLLTEIMETQIPIGGRKTVNPKEVISLKGEINYTTVHFQNGKQKEIVATTLKKIQANLEDFPNFFRVTKSTIINLDCIERIKNNQIYLINGEVIVPSRRRAKVFNGIWGEFCKVD